MTPALSPGQVVFGWRSRRLAVGDIVVFKHDGLEKIKRIKSISGSKLYLIGDNPTASTDSRDFGWVDRSCVVFKCHKRDEATRYDGLEI